MTPRELTYDEKKAAEAAFSGRPFNPEWSPAARSVYDGLVKALPPRPAPGQHAEPLLPSLSAPIQQAEQTAPPKSDPDSAQPAVMSREDAIQAGVLIDVTPLANTLGLRMPVCMTKPLWEVGITASRQLSEEEHAVRARDVLMALRLHLATTHVVSPIIEFPALLSFPPDTAPQLCALYAVAHKDQTAPYSLTLLLPGEASVIIPLLN